MKAAAGRYLSYPLIGAWLVLGLFATVPVFTAIVGGWKEYLWFAGGFAAYIALRQLPFFNKNEGWMQVFSHELAHTAVSLMFLQRINSFTAGSREGRVSYSGSGFGDIFISLAPYCLPLLTYVLLLLRLLSADESLYVFDLLTGFTAAFYATCFMAQTGTHQSDITGQGTVRAFMFILAAWLFNATVILLSVRGGLWQALKTVFLNYAQTLAAAFTWLKNAIA